MSKLYVTRRPVGHPTRGVQTTLFRKTMTISLVGHNQDEIKAVAHAIHSLNHPLTTGTRHKRRVTATTLYSSNTVKIFDGKVAKKD